MLQDEIWKDSKNSARTETFKSDEKKKTKTSRELKKQQKIYKDFAIDERREKQDFDQLKNWNDDFSSSKV